MKKTIMILGITIIIIIVGVQLQKSNGKTSLTEDVAIISMTQSHGGAIQDQVSFIDALRKELNSMEVFPIEDKDAGDTMKAFSATRTKLALPNNTNNESLIVFEFLTEKDREYGEKSVRKDGWIKYTLNSGKEETIGWAGSPHWYKKGRILVIYVGDSFKLISTLKKLVGNQFAGR